MKLHFEILFFLLLLLFHQNTAMQVTRLSRAVKSVSSSRSFASVPSNATVVKFQGFGDPKQVLK